MGGVVAVVDRAATSAAVVSWASTAAYVRSVELRLVHPWDAPVDVSVELEAHELPGLSWPATAQAVPGGLASALADVSAELLVVGRDHDRSVRAQVHHTSCPTAIVPSCDPPKINRVIVGVCGTVSSRAALTWAAREAELRQAELVVMHAWQLHPTSVRDLLQPVHALSAQQVTAEARLHAWVSQQSGAASAELRAVHGAPLDLLLEVASAADLIVLGQHHHPPIVQFMHGALSDDLSRLTDCTIVVVPMFCDH